MNNFLCYLLRKSKKGGGVVFILEPFCVENKLRTFDLAVVKKL